MENYVYLSMCLIVGIFFLWYSQHKKSYSKTAAVQGEEIAMKKFRILRICGYLLVIGAGVFGFLVMFDI